MKKSFLCITASIVLGTMMLFQACKEDDENTQTGNLKIELLTPDATAYVVAPDDLPLAFTWKKTAGTGATTLYISPDAQTFSHAPHSTHLPARCIARPRWYIIFAPVSGFAGCQFGTPLSMKHVSQ
jgi:hypothetical protein